MIITSARGWRLGQLMLLIAGAFCQARVRAVDRVEACIACVTATQCISNAKNGGTSCTITQITDGYQCTVSGSCGSSGS
jgi:hypothetical protein